MTSQTASDSLPGQDVIANSGRWAFLSLFCGAAFWLVVAGVLGLIASIKVHAPALLADCAWFSYGRLKVASTGAFNFGFATQAAVAVGLWLAAVLGSTRVRLPFLSVIAGKVWNIGVFLGVFGVMYGDGSGHAMLEFPRYAMGFLLFAYIGLAIPFFVTFHNRSVRGLYPSVWFVVAGMFWFAWLFSTAVFLLQIAPVRGILQAAVEGWFANGFVTVWLFPIAIALVLYLRPAMSGSSIPSRATILLGFWTLAFIGPWGGIAVGTPLPAWVGGVSSAMSALFLIPVLAIFQSVGGMRRKPSTGAYSRISWGLADYSFLALMLYGVLTAANSFAVFYHVTEFTFVTTALQDLALYGVVSTALFAAAFQILPRLVAPCELSARAAGWHSMIFRVAAGVLVLSLLLAGVGQGRAMANPEVPFASVTNDYKMWFRLSTAGELLVVVAGLIFFAYVVVTFFRVIRSEYLACEWCGPSARAVEVAS